MVGGERNGVGSGKRGSSSTVSHSLGNMELLRSLNKTTMNAKNYKDVDSQADRYRDTIKELEAL